MHLSSAVINIRASPYRACSSVGWCTAGRGTDFCLHFTATRGSLPLWQGLFIMSPFFLFQSCNSNKCNVLQAGNGSPECMDEWYINGLMGILLSITAGTISRSCLAAVSIRYVSTVPMTYAAPRSPVSPCGGVGGRRADGLFNISVRLPADWWATAAAMQGSQPRWAGTSASPYTLYIIIIIMNFLLFHQPYYYYYYKL